MILTNKYLEDLVKSFPNFENSPFFREAVEMFSIDGKVNVHAVFSSLTYYVVDFLMRNNSTVTDEEINLYKFVESIRVQCGDHKEPSLEYEIDSAVCTCFLENLLNRAGTTIEYSRFIPYLGEKSKEYCRAWDQFTGVRSEGLWTNEEWLNAKKSADKGCK